MHHKKRSLNRRSSYRGFTLIEVMLVVVILGIIITVTVPSMARSVRFSRLTSASSAVVRAGKYCRSMAIMSQDEVRLTFHKTDSRVEAHGGSSRVKLDRTLDGVRIDNVEIEGATPSTEDDAWTVSYLRNGRCTPYTVTLANSRDETMTIRVDAFAGAKAKAGM